MRSLKRPSRCTRLRPLQARFWAPGGWSCRGARQKISPRRRGGRCCRQQCWGGNSGRHASAPPRTSSHHDRGPLLGLRHLPPILPGAPTQTTNGGIRRGGGQQGGGVSHSNSPSHRRPASVALLGGGGCGHPRWLCCQPQLYCPPSSNLGRVRRRRRGAGTGACKPCGLFSLHLGRAH